MSIYIKFKVHIKTKFTSDTGTLVKIVINYYSKFIAKLLLFLSLFIDSFVTSLNVLAEKIYDLKKRY